MRRRLLAAAAAITLVAPPAHATVVVTLVCAVQYYTYSGLSSGSGTCVIDGMRHGTVAVTITQGFGTGVDCPAVSTASGSFNGPALYGYFTWLRLGDVAPGNVSGDLNGNGVWAISRDDPTALCGLTTGPASETYVATLWSY